MLSQTPLRSTWPLAFLFLAAAITVATAMPPNLRSLSPSSFGPTLLYPAPGATGVATSLTFSWGAGVASDCVADDEDPREDPCRDEYYHVEVFAVADSSLIAESMTFYPAFVVEELSPRTGYYWRVQGSESGWSPVGTFTTASGGP